MARPFQPRRPGSMVAIALAAALATLAAASTAQEAGDAAARRDRVKADQLRRRVTPLGPVIDLVGNVRVSLQDLTITSQRARRYQLQQRTDFIGTVHAVSDSFTLWADSVRIDEPTRRGWAAGSVRVELADSTLGTGQRGFYDRAGDRFYLAGRARVIQRDFVVTGDSIEIDRRRGSLESFGNVQLVDRSRETVVTGRHARLDDRRGMALVDSLPVLTSRRQNARELRVESSWMAFQRDDEHSRAVGEVRFRQGGTTAEADTADFYGEDLLVLRGHPVVHQYETEMKGKEIRFHYVDGELRRIRAYGATRLVDSSPDTLARRFRGIALANVLEGDTLDVWLEDQELRRTRVRGHAHSVYLPEDQEESVSVNDVVGRSIDIRFAEGRVDSVTVLGGVHGTYRFLERRRIPTASVRRRLPPVEEVAAADTAGVGAPQAGIAHADTAGAGVAQLPTVDFKGLADEVEYEGDHVLFLVPEGMIHIDGDAEVRHGTLGLRSAKIRYDTEKQELLAEGEPLLTDTGSELLGSRMGYLFDARTGAVSGGATRYDDGFYTGKHIRRLDDGTLLVRDGTYTSCDLAHPHYHFQAKKMKLKVGEKVVARQVTFYVSDLPIFALPFYFKSLDSGRHSGILFPNVNVGVSSREGRFVRDLGYYWALSDYTDLTFELDFNERRDLTLTLANVYNVRYGMNGNARLDLVRNLGSGGRSNQWIFRANHTQPDLFDVWNTRASVQLSSSTLSGDPSRQSQTQLIPGQLRSTFSASRTFPGGIRLSATGNRDQFVNARDDDPLTDKRLWSQTLPRVNLSFKTGPVLPPLPRGRHGHPLAALLRNIQFSQSYAGDARQSQTENGREYDLSLNGRWGLSYAPQGRLGPFAITSGTSFSGGYTRNDIERTFYRLGQDTVITSRPDTTSFGTIVTVLDTTVTTVPIVDHRQDEVDEDFRPSLSFTNSLRTDLYGIFKTHLGPIRGIKHKLSYSMGYNYRPQLGNKQQKDQSLSFQLVNELSLKVVEGGGAQDEAGKPRLRKLDQLLRWSLRTSYDPDASPGRRWSNITSSVLVRPGITRAVSFDLNQTIDPYTFEVISTRVQAGLNASGGLDLGGTLFHTEARRNPVVDRIAAPAADSTQVQRDPDLEEFGYGFGDPRSLALLKPSTDRNRMSWSFTARGSFQDNPRRATVNASANLALPGEWSVSYRAGFDVVRGDFTNQFYSVRRNLHDWALEFNRSIAGNVTEYGFRLYLRPIPQIEVTRGTRDLGLLGRFNRF